MLFADDVELKVALADSQVGGVVGIARYRGTQTDLNVASEGQVTFRGSAKIQASTSITVFGSNPSLVPRTKDAPLATYGQELGLWRSVSLRGSERLIPLGIFRIVRAADASERFRGDIAVDWSVDLTLSDRFEAVQADDFLAVDTPVPGNSVWDEIRRLSPFPVSEALGDANVPAATVYDSRLGAIESLMMIIGGVPHLTREGVLTARQADAWLTATTPAFDIPGVIAWSDEMSNDFYNQVRVTNPNDPSVVAYARLLDPWDPLSVVNAGGRTYHQSSPIYTSVGEAQSAANTILERVSSRRARTLKATCAPDALLLELGDVGWVRDVLRSRAVLGEVSALSIPLDPALPIEVELIVAQEAPIVDGEVIPGDKNLGFGEGGFGDGGFGA